MAGFGGAVQLAGETEYRRALQNINQSLKEAGSNLKAVSSEFDKNDNSTKAVKEKTSALNKVLEEQRNKLQLLKDRYDEVSKAEGDHSQELSKLKTEMNNTKASINQTTREMDNLGKETKETGEGFTVFKGILANLGTQAINGVLTGIKNLGSSLVNVGNQAIASYADYEQLSGGVETLFKDSADVVENYANNAYKTAGISANEYMETVTSFSASLLQSLNGDTAKAAGVADMAITDMADNANKMGTSMSSIQSAYQGFAKQNYTMLDNLKLGYGGTKTEMERLLADAGKLTGVKYDISNLNDVYEAIHVIQGELGITGTTAKEASETISGSVSAMKSAWSNLLTGIADENANFDELVNNFVDSLMTVGDNLIPRIQTTIIGIGKLVSQLLSQMIPEIVQMVPPLLQETLPILVDALGSIVEGMLTALPEIVSIFADLIPQITSVILDMLPLLVEVGIEIITNLLDGMSEMLPEIIQQIVDLIPQLVDALVAGIPQLIEGAIKLFMAIVDAIPQIIDSLMANIDVIINSIINGLINAIPQLIDGAIKLFMAIMKAIPVIIKSLAENMPQIIKTIVSGLSAGINQVKEVGINLIKGLWDGIASVTDWIWSKIKGFASGIVDSLKDFFGIHSPSTLFRDEIGENLALGIGEGFTGTMDKVAQDMKKALPTTFDTELKINKTQGIDSMGEVFFDYRKMAVVFKEVLSDMKIELDDEVAGRFVEETVTRAVYT